MEEGDKEGNNISNIFIPVAPPPSLSMREWTLVFTGGVARACRPQCCLCHAGRLLCVCVPDDLWGSVSLCVDAYLGADVDSGVVCGCIFVSCLYV